MPYRPPAGGGLAALQKLSTIGPKVYAKNPIFSQKKQRIFNVWHRRKPSPTLPSHTPLRFCASLAPCAPIFIPCFLACLFKTDFSSWGFPLVAPLACVLCYPLPKLLDFRLGTLLSPPPHNAGAACSLSTL